MSSVTRKARGDAPSARSSILMLSNCSTSSMISFCLLILMTSAALPALRRAKRNLRREAFSSCGISTVWDCNREPYDAPSQTPWLCHSNALPTITGDG